MGLFSFSTLSHHTKTPVKHWRNTVARASQHRPLEKQYNKNPQRQGDKEKQGHLRNLKPPGLYDKNINHSPAPTWININPHKKGMLTSETVLPQRVSTNHSRKSAVWRDRAIVRIALIYDTDVGSIRQGTENNPINTRRDLMEKGDLMQDLMGNVSHKMETIRKKETPRVTLERKAL